MSLLGFKLKAHNAAGVLQTQAVVVQKGDRAVIAEVDKVEGAYAVRRVKNVDPNYVRIARQLAAAQGAGAGHRDRERDRERHRPEHKHALPVQKKEEQKQALFQDLRKQVLNEENTELLKSEQYYGLFPALHVLVTAPAAEVNDRLENFIYEKRLYSQENKINGQGRNWEQMTERYSDERGKVLVKEMMARIIARVEAKSRARVEAAGEIEPGALPSYMAAPPPPYSFEASSIAVAAAPPAALPRQAPPAYDPSADTINMFGAGAASPAMPALYSRAPLPPYAGGSLNPAQVPSPYAGGSLNPAAPAAAAAASDYEQPVRVKVVTLRP